jgi:putative flippase GtrA
VTATPHARAAGPSDADADPADPADPAGVDAAGRGPRIPGADLILRHLPARWRQLTGEAVKFGIVGIANVVINFLVFNLLALTVLTGGELKANIVATAVTVTTSYLMNRHWTFRHRTRESARRERTLFLLFVVFNVAGLAIELAVMGLAKYGVGLTGLLALNIAKAAGIGLGTIFRFWTYRTFVFVRRAAARAQPAPAPQATAPPRRAAAAPATPAQRTSGGFAALAPPLEVELAGALALDAELAAELAEPAQRQRAGRQRR